PAGVKQIVLSDTFYLSGNELGRDVFDLSCRDATVDRSRFDPGAFQYDRAGGDDRVFSDLGVVHNDGTHADEDAIVDDAAMYDGVMTYRNVVADANTGFLVCPVDNDTVLDIYLIAKVDTIDIAPYHGVEPNATIVAHLYVAHYCGVRCDKTIFSKAGGFAF